MSRIALICFSIVLLVGCGKADRARLDRADSLLVADSAVHAMRLLRTFVPTSLTRENNAYYAILYTQAQYKCFEPITSDSLISIAEKYYRLDGNTKMYGQASAYKGVALMEMGLPTEAIYYIRQAEQVTDSTDFFMLGWLNLRLGELYQMTYADNEEDINKYKKAATYFSAIDSQSTYVSYSYSKLGQLYRLSNIDSANYYLRKAIELDKSKNNTIGLLYDLGLLGVTYELDSNYHKATELCLDVINKSATYDNLADVFYCLARSYAKLGQIDSAYYYLNTNNIVSAEDSANYFHTKYVIEKIQGRHQGALSNYIKCNAISESILTDARRHMLSVAEKQYDNSRVEQKNEELNVQLTARNYFITLICILIVILVVLVWRIFRRKDERAKQYLLLIEQLQTESAIKPIATDVKLKIESQVVLRDAMVKRLAIIGEMITLSYEYKDREKLFAKKFNELITRDPLSSDAYGDILNVVNSGYYYLIDHLRAQYPAINDRELLICALTCIGYSSQQLFIILGAKSIETIYNQKYRIGVKLEMKGDLKSSLEKIIETLQNRL